jgi:tripartite-type tricarboxylate transporter receptor subunit TctC
MADRVARLIADKFREKWGQPGIVDNRPGASANIGGEHVAKAAPDGYTLLVAGDNPLVINKALFPKLSYDPDAFVPVSVVLKGPLILVVNPKVPAANLQELLAYAKSNPDRLNLGSNGNGSNMHLSLELLKMETGVRITHVPYKGVPNALTDLIGGQVEMMFVGLGTVLQQVKAGKLRVLAVASEKRMAALPDVPAVAEAVPGFAAATWFAVVATPKTPATIAARLSGAIAEMVRSPAMVSLMETLSVEGVGSTPEETSRFLVDERVRWSKVIRTTGLKAE